MGPEPSDQRVVEPTEGSDEGEEERRCQVVDVLSAGRELGARREGENEGLDGGVDGEELVEVREVFGGDDDGDGDSAGVVGGDLVGQVQEWYHVALCWEWEDQYMGGSSSGCHGES